MSLRMGPYPKYKDPGFPWLGPIPKHWNVRRAKYLLREVNERSPDGKETLLSVSQYMGVTPRRLNKIDDQPDTRAASLVGYKVVTENDLVVNIMLAWNGSLGVAPSAGIVSPAYCVYRFREDSASQYYHHLLRSPLYKGRIKASSTGVVESRLRLYTDDLFRVEMLLPSRKEQERIARFLDHIDRRINRLIRSKRRLIELLNEQKQAIINRAVTRGLDPNARRKPSGIDWLGDVPEHWEIRRFKSLVRRIDQGVSPQAESYLAEGDTWGVLKAGCVNGGVFRQTEHKRLPDEFLFDSGLALSKGDVIVSRASGSPHLVGSVGRVLSLSYKLILSDKTFRAVFNRDADPDFMVLSMNSRRYRQQVEQAISGAEGLANNLPLSSLRAFYFAVPSVEEQRQIVVWLHKSVVFLDTISARAEREIALLREYRTRLIADVVTGKLDVREAAVKLPDESESLPEAGDLLDEGDALRDQMEASVAEPEA